MKKAELEKKLHERLDGLLNKMEEVRTEFEGVFAEKGEQAHASLTAMGDEFFLVQVTYFNGTKYHSLVNGKRSKGEWTEYGNISGDYAKKDDEK